MADLAPDKSEARADPTSSELSWLRSDFSNLRTLLAWSRTVISLIGFGFTVFNFSTRLAVEADNARIETAAQNLGMAMVMAGAATVIVALWNFWSINRYMEELPIAVLLTRRVRRRWMYGYFLAATLIAIGLIVVLFMLRLF